MKIHKGTYFNDYRNLKVKFASTGTLLLCCKPSSGAGVVWVETRVSLGQVQTWPYNGANIFLKKYAKY